MTHLKQPLYRNTMQELYKAMPGTCYTLQLRSKNLVQRWFHTNRYRIAADLVLGKHFSGRRILDVGCASCDWNSSGLPVIGVDLNEALLRTGRQKGSIVYPLVGDGNSFPIKAGSVDIITAFEFLEHMAEPGTAVEEMHRILNDGGHVLISVPFDHWCGLWPILFKLHCLIQGYVFRSIYYRKKCGHLQSFDKKRLSHLFSTRGFSVDLVFAMAGMTLFLTAQKIMVPNPARETGRFEDLTIVLPTLNEERSISHLLERLINQYPGVSIVVSDDGSTDATQALVLRFHSAGVRLINRTSCSVHGLSASLMDAIGKVKTRYCIVMDADGQHPVATVSDLINRLRSGFRLVVASRAAVDAHWPFFRRVFSQSAAFMGKLSLLLRKKRFANSDILSGFFGFETSYFDALVNNRPDFYKPRGYKLLFDFLKLMPADQPVSQVYYRFRTRQASVSKLKSRVIWEYLVSLFW